MSIKKKMFLMKVVGHWDVGVSSLAFLKVRLDEALSNLIY